MRLTKGDRNKAGVGTAIFLALFVARVFLMPAVMAWADDEPEAPAITPQHYCIFHGDGTPATLDDILVRARMAEVTFLGEEHDDPVAHYLELEILKQLASSEGARNVGRAKRTPDVLLSLEMFERDVQLIVDEYTGGFITERAFLESARPWKNYKTDYRPLVEFAKELKIPVVAANAPSRYVNRVGRMGKASLEQLSKAAKAFLPPLPYADASKAYEEAFKRVMEKAEQENGEPEHKEAAAKESGITESAPKEGLRPDSQKKDAEGKDAGTTEAARKKEGPAHQLSNPRFALEAQSLWDAAMAYSIAQALKAHPNAHVLQVNGGFHSQRRLGILEHLARYRPQTKSIVVTISRNRSFPAWDEKKLAALGDFVVVTDPSLKQSAKSGNDGSLSAETKANGEPTK
jgi:uncharacterized iron-regulated protein